jgi:hypothetical protein
MAKSVKQAEEFLTFRKRFARALNDEDENRSKSLEDIRFRNGDQWNEKAKKERDEDSRPCLTFNRCEGFIDQVTGDARQNKIDIKVTAVDDSPYAPLYEKLIDKIERESKATIAYQTALDHSAGSGWGWIRVGTEYLEGSFDQDCKIMRITNQFSVYPDPDAKEQTKSDMKWCFVASYIEKDEFKKKYPNASVVPLNEAKGEAFENWFGDKIRIAEYFEQREVKTTIYLLSDNSIVEDIKNIGELTVINQREDISHEIYRSLISGSDYLEEPKRFAGKYIPLIFVAGKELHEEGKTHYRGVIRHSKDAQVAYNFHRNASAESVGVAPKSPWLATAEQVEGHEDMWRNANTKNFSALIYNHKPGQPPPMRQSPAGIPMGAVNEAAMALDDLKGTTGIFDASLGAMGNETSGKAILARQSQGDNATFAYHDNLAISIEQVGRVLVSMIPEIYDGERVLRLQTPDGEVDMNVNQAITDGQGQPAILNDLTLGKYSVQVTTGASYATRRIEERDVLMQLVQVSPELRSMAMDKVIESFDFDSSDEIAKRLTPPDQNNPPPPNAEQQVQMAELEADKIKSEATIKTAEATIAKAAATEAEAKYKFASIGMENDKDHSKLWN